MARRIRLTFGIGGVQTRGTEFSQQKIKLVNSRSETIELRINENGIFLAPVNTLECAMCPEI